MEFSPLGELLSSWGSGRHRTPNSQPHRAPSPHRDNPQAGSPSLFFLRKVKHLDQLQHNPWKLKSLWNHLQRVKLLFSTVRRSRNDQSWAGAVPPQPDSILGWILLSLGRFFFGCHLPCPDPTKRILQKGRSSKAFETIPKI